MQSVQKMKDASEAASELEAINHLEGEGDVARFVNPVDLIVVEARHSLPVLLLVQHIFWRFSTPRHV